MIKVKNGQDPYSVIGKYIRDHVSAIEDIIAVIEIDGKISNELFMVDMQEDGYFIWNSDWYEGEQNIALIDFFPVSDAEPAQKNEPVGCNGCRYDWFGDPRCAKCARSFQDYYEADSRCISEETKALPSAQTDAVTTSLEELINDYGEDGYFIVDGVNYQANELLNELKANSSVGEKFRRQITKTIVQYFMKFGG